MGASSLAGLALAPVTFFGGDAYGCSIVMEFPKDTPEGLRHLKGFSQTLISEHVYSDEYYPREYNGFTPFYKPWS